MESPLLPTFANIFLPSTESLSLDNVSLSSNLLELHISNCASQAACPECKTMACRIHSHYQRTLTDLPFCQFQIHIYWCTRRFFCDAGNCRKITFTEQIPELAIHHARKTHRLAERLRQIGFEAGGEAGRRLADIFGVAASGDQILRLIRMSGEPNIPNLKVVGIDDWAWRKRQSYGTILVDLEKKQVIDLLADRQPETVASWLKKHPEIEFISRDRGQEYIEGISRGLPDAIQIADRFHLLRNLLETLQKMLEPEHEALKLANQQIRTAYKPRSESSPIVPAPTESSKTTTQIRFDEVKALQLEGMAQREISRRMGIDRRTVSKYFRLNSLPTRKDRVLSASKAAPYQHHLSKRINEGCQNLTQLYEELRQMGFDGSYASVSRAAHRLGVGDLKCASPSALPPVPRFSPKQAAWALFQPESLLKEPLLSFRNSLCNISANASKAQVLAQTFRDLIKNRQADKLDAWLIDAEQSAIPEFIRLATSFRADYDAVKMGLHSPWSNGQVEGQNNRLKLIKRQMYGRAGFQLLRMRVLGPAPFS